MNSPQEPNNGSSEMTCHQKEHLKDAFVSTQLLSGYETHAFPLAYATPQSQPQTVCFPNHQLGGRLRRPWLEGARGCMYHLRFWKTAIFQTAREDRILSFRENAH